MVGFALLNVVVTFALGTMFRILFDTNANPVAAQLSQVSTSQLTLFFLETVPQLLGEELVTILPFLAITYFAYSRMDLSRGSSILIAWLLTALIFALLHLPRPVRPSSRWALAALRDEARRSLREAG